MTVETPSLDVVPVAALLVSRAGIVLWSNEGAPPLLGVPPGDLVGSQLDALISHADGLLFDAASGLGVIGDGRTVRAGFVARRRETVVPIDVVLGPLGAIAGSPDARVVVLLEASSRVASSDEADRLRAALATSEAQRARLAIVQEELVEPDVPEMIGSSLGLARVREQVARVAPTSTTVLVQGETGSGKELVARSIHAGSPRSRRTFVAVNCAALPESLIESELFGHERGAFTGADRQRLGKFELADGGTLFLDEVAELPLPAQAKLLRVLQDGTFERVGGSEQIGVDVRLIAATHRDLIRQVSRSLFREDLFYRLNVFRIEVPPLRERREDLRALVEHLHVSVARRMAKPVLPISERSMRRVLAYRWPGNIRELANAVERATLLADGPELEIELPEIAPAERSSDGTEAAPTRDILLDLTLEQLQRLHIMHALETSRYRVFGDGGAAKRLEINPQTLLSRMDKFGIPRPRSVRQRPGGGD